MKICDSAKCIIQPRAEYTWRFGRPIFWFRADAEECLARIWNMIAIFNEEGLYVEHRTTLRPGHIVFRDEYQIAAIPDKR